MSFLTGYIAQTRGYRFRILLAAFPLACIVAFFAMNFNGALAFLGEFGQWVIAQLMNVWSLGLSGLWWIAQAVTAFFANIIVGAFNAVVGAMNERLGALGVEIPMWGYITSPTVNTTFQQILVDMGYQNQQLTLVGQQYVQTVSANPIQSAAIGLGTGGATVVTAASGLSNSGIIGGGGPKIKDGSRYSTYERSKQKKSSSAGKATYDKSKARSSQSKKNEETRKKVTESYQNLSAADKEKEITSADERERRRGG